MYHPQTTEAPWKDSRNGFLSKSVAQVYPNYPGPGPKKKRAKRWRSIKRPMRDAIPSIWADHFKHFRLQKRNTTQVTKRYLSSGEKICDSSFTPSCSESWLRKHYLHEWTLFSALLDFSQDCFLTPEKNFFWLHWPLRVQIKVTAAESAIPTLITTYIGLEHCLLKDFGSEIVFKIIIGPKKNLLIYGMKFWAAVNFQRYYLFSVSNYDKTPLSKLL